MFAEIFAIEHTPAAQRDKRDRDILEHFKDLIKVIHDHAKVKNENGNEQSIVQKNQQVCGEVTVAVSVAISFHRMPLISKHYN